MTHIVDEMPQPIPIGGIVHTSRIELVVRCGRTGEIKERTVGYNNKISNTYSILISAIVNSDGSRLNSIFIAGVGSGVDVIPADTSLTAEIGGASWLRTEGLLSWDAGTGAFNYSFSFTANSITYTVGTVGLFYTYTGDGLFLKTSIAQTQVSSQDSLYVSWLQSFASA